MRTETCKIKHVKILYREIINNINNVSVLLGMFWVWLRKNTEGDLVTAVSDELEKNQVQEYKKGNANSGERDKKDMEILHICTEGKRMILCQR